MRQFGVRGLEFHSSRMWQFAQVERALEVMAATGLNALIGGIIVSPGTRESKVSVSTSTCGCPRCARASRLDWYTALLDTMYRPLAARGKTLAVRDFSYTADHQSLIIKAAARCSPDVVISLASTS